MLAHCWARLDPGVAGCKPWEMGGARCYFKWSFIAHCALARNFTTRHLPCMDDSTKENGFKLREMVVPVCNSVGSTGMNDGRWLYVGGVALPRKSSRTGEV